MEPVDKSEAQLNTSSQEGHTGPSRLSPELIKRDGAGPLWRRFEYRTLGERHCIYNVLSTSQRS